MALHSYRLSILCALTIYLLATKDACLAETSTVRKLVLDGRGLHLPVKTGSPKGRMQLVVDGRSVRQFDIELAEKEPDFWAWLDVSAWRGKEAAIEWRGAAASGRNLEAIRVADAFPDVNRCYREKYRPQFHYSSRVGWVNDPNGQIYHCGQWHLYYQHNPYGVKWGNMHWGHAVSRDLVRWQELPEALYPGELGEMFSGSAVADVRNSAGFQATSEPPLVAFFTGTANQCNQSIAFSNDCGRTWTNYASNPVLRTVVPGNRDPKVFWHDPSKTWVMVLYLAKNDFGLFGSTDLKRWTELSRLTLDGMNECPDLFPLMVDGRPEQLKWVFVAGHGSPAGDSARYVVGRFDGRVFTPEAPPRDIDQGCGYYSTQTFSDTPHGERIQIVWAGRPFDCPGYPGMPFNGQFWFPRTLSLRRLSEGIRLCQEPVASLDTLRAKTHSWKNVSLRPGETFGSTVRHDLLDIQADVELDRPSDLLINIRGGSIRYNSEKQLLHAFGKSVPLAMDGRHLHLRILADRVTLELFGRNGAFTMSGYFMPEDKAAPLRISAEREAATIVSLEVHELRSAWE